MTKELSEWVENYLRSRDVFEKKIVSIEKQDGGLVVVYKDYYLKVLCEEELSSSAPEEGRLLIVTLQKESNLELLYNNFSAYSKNRGLTMIFVNPSLNEKWVIKPSVHSAVADKTSLKAGLVTLFQAVPAV